MQDIENNNDIKNTVRIPYGAYDPRLDTPTDEWYSPTIINVQGGQTVLWNNTDKEAHTVTSGKGAGRLGWTSGELGEADGRFNSGRFMPGETWSHTFSNPGTYPYFCKIHPWMEGVVVVGPSIPDHPVDGVGNKIKEFPVIRKTPDGQYLVEITWEPRIIKTGEKVTTAIGIYDAQSDRNLPRISYEVVIEQGTEELLRLNGETEKAGSFVRHVFKENGPIKIKFNDVAGKSGNDVEFSTIVFENPQNIKPEEVTEIQPARNIRLSQTVLSAIILTPTAIFVAVLIMFMRGKEKQKRSLHEERTENSGSGKPI